MATPNSIANQDTLAIGGKCGLYLLASTNKTFPSGFIKRNHYNSYGYVDQVKNTAGQILHQKNTVSPFGTPTSETFLNGTSKNTSYNPSSGRVQTITQTNLPDLDYIWRSNGHLYRRKASNVTEIFTYDYMNRLKSAGATGGRFLSYGYDNLGNINYLNSNLSGDKKATSLTYSAGSNGPHRLMSGTYDGIGHNFVYDGVGNVTAINASTGNSTFTYDANNRVKTINKGGVSQQFSYAPDGNRFYKYSSAGNKHTFYLYGGTYEDVRVGSSSSGTRTTQITDAVQHTKNASGTESYLYLRRDHLGSIDGMLNSSGNMVEYLGFDPFGSRRAGTWASDISAADLADILNNEDVRGKKGLTGHEHLDRVDVIHMNGRIYDPRFGRFLNVDPVNDNILSSQRFNKYSYVNNSPLSFTDPSGYCFTDGCGDGFPGEGTGILFILFRDTAYDVLICT